MKNSMFTLSLIEREYPFYAKFVSKIKLFVEAETWRID